MLGRREVVRFSDHSSQLSILNCFYDCRAGRYAGMPAQRCNRHKETPS